MYLKLLSELNSVMSALGTEQTNQLRLSSSLSEKRTAGLPVVYTLTGGCRYYAGPAKHHADDNACTPLLPLDNAQVFRTVSKHY